MIYKQTSKNWEGVANVTIIVNGQKPGSGSAANVLPTKYSATEKQDISTDLGSTNSH